jgi:hypothetical protein
LFDSSNKTYIKGTDVVEVVIRFRGQVLPWASRVVLTEEQAKEAERPLRTCVEIGAELLATFNAPAGLKVRVLFDTAYLAECVIKVVDDKRWKIVSRAKPDRVVVPGRGRKKADGKNQHVGQYMRNCLRRGTHVVEIGKGKRSRRCAVAIREADLQGVGRVKFVSSTWALPAVEPVALSRIRPPIRSLSMWGWLKGSPVPEGRTEAGSRCAGTFGVRSSS